MRYLFILLLLFSCSNSDDGPTQNSNDDDGPIQNSNSDTTPPVITILGDTTITIEQYEIYIDPGATAIDNVDGDITSNINTTSDVDTDIIGSYSVVYEVSDSAGNTAMAIRSVIVEISDNLTFIPDDNFELYLIHYGYDDVFDDHVLTSNIIPITELSMIFLGISDLTGIEDFVNLERLVVTDNKLTSINLSQNIKLIHFESHNNNLFEIDVSQNELLEVLEVRAGALTTIDVTNNKLLKELVIRDNTISQIDLSQNTVLELINCTENNLSTLNLTNNSRLVQLAAERNNLESIFFPVNSNLRSLWINENNLTSLDVSGISTLRTLKITNNQLVELNIANGNNRFWTAIDGFPFDARENILDCIQIDTGFTPPTDGSWKKDPQTMYSDNCI